MRCARCTTVFRVDTGAGPANIPDATPAAPSGASLEVAVAAIAPGPLRDLASGALARSNVRTISVEDGPSAIEVTRRSRPRLLIVSAWLPGLTGAEVVQVVHDDPALAQCRTLLLGGPPASGRYQPPLERVHRVDAHLQANASVDDVISCLRLLLRRETGPAALDDAADSQGFVRLEIDDLRLYHGDTIDDDLRTGQPLSPGVEHALDAARLACLERFPHAGSARRSALLSMVNQEIDDILVARRQAVEKPNEA